MTLAADAETDLGYAHGPQTCRACFPNPGTQWHSPVTQLCGASGDHQWQLRPNPGYWGSAAPRFLVLGFSKGPEQNALIDRYVRSNGTEVLFEDIPFNDKNGQMRANLKKILLELGLVEGRTDVSALFQSTEREFGFASLVRCTTTYASPKSDTFVGSGGGITARTLELAPAFVATCVDRYVKRLPTSVQLVVMLGATTGFVDSVRKMLNGDPLVEGRVRAYAYRFNMTPIVHVPHPSGGNNGAVAVFCRKRAPTSDSEKNIPECREQAAATLTALRRLWAEQG